MSEDTVVESSGSGEGGYVGILDVAVIGGLLVVAVILIIRFRRQRMEDHKSLRKLSVVSR